MVWLTKSDYVDKKTPMSKGDYMKKRRLATQDKSRRRWCRNCITRVNLDNIITVEQVSGKKIELVKQCSYCGVQGRVPLKTKPKGAPM